MRVFESFKNNIKNTRVSFQQFPLPMICVLLYAVSLIYSNHTGEPHTIFNVGSSSIFSLVMALGFFLFLAGNLLNDSYESSWIKNYDSFKIVVYLIVVIILVSMYLTLKPAIGTSSVNSVFYIYWGVLLAAITACTFVGRLHTADHFERYVGKIFQSELIALFYSLVLYGGCSAVLFALVHLFSLDLNSEIYLDILILIFGPFQAGVFLAGFPRKIGEEVGSLGGIFRGLVQKILTPLLLIYTVILYLYFIKMFVTGEIPSNIIRNLFIWYGIVSVVVLFFHSSYREDEGSRKFLGIYPALVIPTIVVYFYALILRVKDLGITESRYLGLAFGAYVFICLIYFIWRRGQDNRVLPVILVILLLLGSFGPQGMVATSRRSQEKRLESYLLKNDMLKDGKIVAKSNIKDEDKAEIASIARYLLSSYETKDLKYFPKDFTMASFEDVFGFKQGINVDGPSDTNNAGFNYYAFDQQEFLDINGYDQYYFLTYSGPDQEKERDFRYFVVKDDNGALVIDKKDGNKTREFIRLSWEEILKKGQVLLTPGSVPNINEFSFEGKSLGQRYRLVVSSLSTDALQENIYIEMILLVDTQDK